MRERLLIAGGSKPERNALSLALAAKYTVLQNDCADDVKRTVCREKPAAILLDLNLADNSALSVLRDIKWDSPNSVIIVVPLGTTIDDVAEAMRDGADDFVRRPIDVRDLQVRLDHGIRSKSKRSIRPAELSETLNYFYFDQIVGRSAEMRSIIELARKVANSEISCVLLQGESGTGKDCLAKAIHFASDRAAAPFIAINCAAIPAHLLESELFGHEKGAFTDAKNRKEGLLEQAGSGTVFLDEIGDLDIELQAKLLRVLEEGCFRRVGGLKSIPFDARVIAASNRDLQKEVSEGNLRLDLYYRLAVVSLDIAPLRDRGDDLLLLTEHFIDQFGRRPAHGDVRGLSPEATDAFRNYDWPGNVRELRNAIERAVVFEEGEWITLKYLPKGIAKPIRSTGTENRSPALNTNEPRILPFALKGVSLDQVERSCIDAALSQTGGNLTRAAKILGISRDKMRYRVKKRHAQAGAARHSTVGV